LGHDSNKNIIKANTPLRQRPKNGKLPHMGGSHTTTMPLADNSMLMPQISPPTPQSIISVNNQKAESDLGGENNAYNSTMNSGFNPSSEKPPLKDFRDEVNSSKTSEFFKKDLFTRD
jgi:hypothetical protein